MVKTLFLTVIFLLAACASPTPPPRVVTVVVPYVALLPIESFSDFDGRVRCDLQGNPVIYIRTTMEPEQQAWIIVHERVHVAQSQAYPGGCFGLRDEMARDSMFRLRVEAAAYCETFNAQRVAKVEPRPTFGEIVTILRQYYLAAYDSSAVRSAMPCSP